jgi:hypothetical protein
MDYNSDGCDMVLNNAIFGSLDPLGHQTSILWDYEKDAMFLLPMAKNNPELE